MLKQNDISPYKIREVDRTTWDLCWKKVCQANLMQSWEYGEAKAATEKWTPLRFIFEDMSGKAIAVVQIMTRTWPILGGVARLNRGPLLMSEIEEEEASALVIALLSLLLKEGIKRRWFLFYLAPELIESKDNTLYLQELGLHKRYQNAWGSVRLSLQPDESALMAGLKGKWRNLLRKAQKSDLTLEHYHSDMGKLEATIAIYEKMQREKGFTGVPSKLLKSLARQQGSDWRFSHYIVRSKDASSDNEWAGALVSIIHGDSATYLIGTTNNVGRKMNANYLLLWTAICDARKAGCVWFDMGGLNVNTTKGIAHFKKGIQGLEYILIGEYKK